MIGANDPFLLFCLAAVALLGAMVLGWFAVALPRHALAFCYLIVILATTKLRVRDASLSLAGQFDFQVLLEAALYAVVCVVVVSVYLARRRALRPLAPPELLLFGYALLALCSAFWSVIPAFTFIRAAQLLILFGLAALSVRVLGPDAGMRAASRTLVLFVLVCATAAASGLPWASAFIKTDYTGFTRFAWFAVHPISAATQAGLAAVSVCVTASTAPFGWRDRRYGIPAWLCFGALATILVLTYSRGPLLATLAAGAVLLFKRLRLRGAITLAAVATLIIVAVLVTREFGSSQTGDEDDAVSHAFRRGQDARQLTGLSGRVDLWKAAIPVFTERPVFGNGYHGARPILLRYASWAGYAHNAYFQTLLDLGIVGALLICPVLVWAALIGFRRFRGGREGGVHAFVLATSVFLGVNAVSSESFAGTPTYDILLLFLCTTLASSGDDVVARRATVSPLRRGPSPGRAIASSHDRAMGA
jgi:O-antigen ligase